MKIDHIFSHEFTTEEKAKNWITDKSKGSKKNSMETRMSEFLKDI